MYEPLSQSHKKALSQLIERLLESAMTYEASENTEYLNDIPTNAATLLSFVKNACTSQIYENAITSLTLSLKTIEKYAEQLKDPAAAQKYFEAGEEQLLTLVTEFLQKVEVFFGRLASQFGAPQRILGDKLAC